MSKKDFHDPITGTPYDAERHTGEEFARMQAVEQEKYNGPEPLTPGHDPACTCWQCGQAWLEANYEK